jgi:hypothetical protein
MTSSISRKLFINMSLRLEERVHQVAAEGEGGEGEGEVAEE